MDRPVVAGVDGSMASLGAVRWAADEAARHGRTLRIVHAMSWEGHADGQGIVLDAADDARAWQPGISVETVTVGGRPGRVLQEQSRSASLVAIGGRTHDGGQLNSSVCAQLAAYAHCPVLVVNRGERWIPESAAGPPTPELPEPSQFLSMPELSPHFGGGAGHAAAGSGQTRYGPGPVSAVPRRGVRHVGGRPGPDLAGPGADPMTARPGAAPVVVGVDGSPSSWRALEFAYDEALSRHVPMVALHAGRARSHAAVHAELTPWLRGHGDVDASFAGSDEPVVEALTGAADSALLLVLGAHRDSWFENPRPNPRTQLIVHHAASPVLVTRSV
ncbi:universal stress protein [Dactylosporangium sp. NPDC050588]|uniref:universal stress protein n=1 Tax=Dactylosporangium sp. NPDC050588 TaxID=3157211 RepID=UPI0033BFE33C